MSSSSRPDSATPARRYLYEPAPLYFPASEEMPETRRHLELRTALFQMLQAAFGDRAVIGSEQFVYWEALNPGACCAPDIMLRFGQPDAPFDSWKVWQRGAPDLAIEVLSKSDSAELPFSAKLVRYRQMGVAELVSFNLDDEASPLRIWDRLEAGDLAERDAQLPGFNKSGVLPGYWWANPAEVPSRALRLARDEAGTDFYLLPAESAVVERARAEAARASAEAERERAFARVAELEAELARLRQK